MVMTHPKVILHEHIEGSITPQMARLLANKNHINLPDDLFYASGEYDVKAFPQGRYRYNEQQFSAFIKTYDTVASLVKSPEDYYLITKDFLLRNAAQGLIYCELLISPYHMCAHEHNGEISWDKDRYYDIIIAMEEAIAEVQQDYTLVVKFLAIGVKHLGADKVYATLQFVQQHPHALIVGFNIAGDELAGSFADLKHAHQLAERLGLKKSYHAGEIGSDQSISDAIEWGAERIGHGIRAIDNPELIAYLITHHITLEIALTSNRILVNALNGDIHQHPLRQLYDAGVRLTLNTDDAGIFGTDIDKEYGIAARDFQFSAIELLDISLCGLQAAFIDDYSKQQLINKVYQTRSLQEIRGIQQMSQDRSRSDAIRQRFSEYARAIAQLDFADHVLQS